MESLGLLTDSLNSIDCHSPVSSGKYKIFDCAVQYYICDLNLPIVFTFDDVSSAGPVDERSCWGFEYVKKKGLNVIGILESNKTGWYRSENIISTLKTLADLPLLTKFPSRITYGTSMGGYAASAFSNLLKADRAILLSPISTLNKNISPWDNRYAAGGRNNWKSDYYDGASEIECIHFITYDPLFREDLKHAKRFDDSDPITYKIRCPGLGHSTALHLNKMNILDKLFNDVISNQINSDAYFQSLKNRRNVDKYYFNILSKASRKKSITGWRVSIIYTYLIKHILSSSASTQHAMERFGRIFYSLKNELLLESICRFGGDNYPSNKFFAKNNNDKDSERALDTYEELFLESIKLRREGKYLESIKYAKKCFNINQNESRPLRQIADIYRISGLYDEARLYIKKALIVAPELKENIKLRDLVDKDFLGGVECKDEKIVSGREHLIYKSKNLSATFFTFTDRKDKVVISFVGRNKNTDLKNIFENSFCEKNNVSLIAVSCSSNDWYQYEDFERLCNTISKEIEEFSESIVYGASMGGYGALLSSVIINPDVCIALSPQYTADPKHIPFDTRWRKDVENVNFLFGPAQLNDKTSYYMIYDNVHKVDREHIKRISSTNIGADVKKYKVPFSGHVVGDFNPKYLGYLVSEIFNDNLNNIRSEENRRELRKGSFVYFSNLSLFLFKKNKYNDALGAVFRARKINNTSSSTYILESKIYLRIKAYNSALDVAIEGLRLDDSNDLILRHIASIYLLRSEHSKALEYIDLALATNPNEYSNHFLNYQILKKINENNRAIQSLEVCIKLRPDITKNIDLLRSLQESI